MEVRVKRLYGWLASVAAIIIAVVCIRTFVVGSYRISTPAMENALLNGDYVLVDKLRSKDFLRRNDIFLFKSPLLQDRDDAPLLVSRCIALPGDTIVVSDEGYLINGILYPRSPTSLAVYTFSGNVQEHFLSALRRLNIPLRSISETPSALSLQLTSFEEYLLREELPPAMSIGLRHQATEPYTIVVPRRGETYRLTEGFLIACREAIRLETNDRAYFHAGKLYVKDSETEDFTFSRDYYWALSDNISEAIDSRQLGFIPSDKIIGKAWFCWFSSGSHRSFKRID